jgi:hemoglobin
MEIGRGPRPEATPYKLLGGEPKLRELVNRFYDLMDTEPAFSGIRRLHPPSLEGSREKIFLFLSGFLGGPQLYVEKFGHPMLRARHMHVSIGEVERDQWMACMTRAMEETGIEPEVRDTLVRAFYKTADWMRNRDDSIQKQRS